LGGDVVEAEGRGTTSPGEGSGEGAVPLPRIFSLSILDLKMASFGALWVPVGDASPILPTDHHQA